MLNFTPLRRLFSATRSNRAPSSPDQRATVSNCGLIRSLLCLLALLIGHGQALATTLEHRPNAPLWQYQEWQLSAQNIAINPFDVEASVVFSHRDSATTLSTGMFYDGNWRFRFTPTLAGDWDFVSHSNIPELDSLSGSLTAMVEPGTTARGWLEAHQGGWRWSATHQAANTQYVQYALPDRFHGQSQKIAQDIELFIADHGFGGFHVPALNMGWFQLQYAGQGVDSLPYDPELNPDPATFEALEQLIQATYQAGGSVHLQLWDGAADGLPWQASDPAARRLQNYLAARLGPLPGWTLGIGQPGEEGTGVAESLALWRHQLQEKLAWPHLLVGAPTLPDESGLSPLGVPTGAPDYQEFLALRNQYPQRALLATSGFFIPFVGQGSDEDYGLELTRRGLWQATMAGGLGAIWGNFLEQDQLLEPTEGSVPYPNAGLLQTYQRFFFENGRLLVGMVPDSSLSDSAWVLRDGDRNLIFYQQDTDEIHLNLSQMPDALPVVAVDTRQPYAELTLGLVQAGDQIWTAPHGSDWVLAIGDIASPQQTTSEPAQQLSKAITVDDATGALTLGNPTVNSARGYRWINSPGIDVGVSQYTDRGYRFETVPEEFIGLPFLQTANSDKRSTGDSFISFSANQDVRVLVAHDDRYHTRPAWLGEFSDTGMDLHSPAGNFSLFSRDRPAGTITLGGNSPDGSADHSMYSVIVQPLGNSGQGGGGDGTDTSGSTDDPSEPAGTGEPPDPGEPLSPGEPVVASGREYQWVLQPGLAVDARQYMDRNYFFRVVPAEFQGLPYLQTANNDKRSTGDSFLSFTVDRQVRVHVAHDDRYTTRPAWLDGYTDSGLDLQAAGVSFSVLVRDFAAGTVVLGGNSPAGQSDHSMYSVFLQPLAGDNDSGGGGDNTLASPSIIQQPHDQTVSEGSSVSFSVVSSGSEPMNYQWLMDDLAIPGATTDTLVLNSVTPEDAGDYQCMVSNDAGTATSDTARLVVESDGGTDTGGGVEPGREIHVDGSYAGSAETGTPAEPYKSIQSAVDVAQPGDVVLVHPGNYQRVEMINGNGGGLDERYVTYRSVIKQEATISASDGDCVTIENNSYIAIEDFRLVNCEDAGIYVGGRYAGVSGYENYKSRGFRFSGNYIAYTETFAIGVQGQRFSTDLYERVDEDLISDVLIENNEITKTNQPDGVNECISVGRGLDGFVIRNNLIYDSDQYGIDAKMGAKNGEIYGNVIRNMEKHGIYLDTANHHVKSIKVFNNLIYWTVDRDSSYGSSGIVMARENRWDKDSDGNYKDYDLPANMEDIEVFNNTVVNADNFGILAYKHCYEIIGSSCPNGRTDASRDIDPLSTFKGIKIHNNIVVGTRDHYGISIDEKLEHPGTSDLEITNNVLWDNARFIENDMLGTVMERDNLAMDPLFVSIAQEDFRLTGESPAVNWGRADVGLAYDLACRMRISSPDAGALELDEGQGIASECLPLSAGASAGGTLSSSSASESTSGGTGS